MKIVVLPKGLENRYAKFLLCGLSMLICFGGFAQSVVNNGFEKPGAPTRCPCPFYYSCENDAGQVFDGVQAVYDLSLSPHGCLSGETWANELGAHEGKGYVNFYAGSDKLLAPKRYFVGNETLDLCIWYAGPQGPCYPDQNGPKAFFSFGMDGERLGENISVPCGTGWTEYCMSLDMSPGVHEVSIWSGEKGRYSMWFDSWSVMINSVFEVDLGLDTLLCTGDTLVLDATTPEATYEWFDGSTNPTYVVRGSGLYWVKVTTAEGTAAGSLNVKYWDYPQLELGDALLLCEDDKPFELDVSSSATTTLWPDGTTYLWSTGETNPIITVEEGGMYWVGVGRGGCVTTDSVEVSFYDCDLRLNIPNIFSPNNDGKNDVFSFSNGDKFQDIHIFIMNRWGELLYEGAAPWDGSYFGTPCSEGVYFWKVEYKSQLGENFDEYGSLQLIR